MTRRLKNIRRLVVKIGSAILVGSPCGELQSHRLNTLVHDLVTLRRQGTEIVIVTSGAIALGKARLERISTRQVCAAVGQIKLASYYEEAFARYGLLTAQLLFSAAELRISKEWLDFCATIKELLAAGVVPIVNENDAVAQADHLIGDNDLAAAWIARLTNADTLVLLTDVDGLFTSDPRLDESARHITMVTASDLDVMTMASQSSNGSGSGGMITKVQAAQIAVRAGIRTIIANGSGNHPLQALDHGSPATWFLVEGADQYQTMSEAFGCLVVKNHQLENHGNR